ncbi:MAG: AmmeMemoRadiSam system protein B [bacterium]|nr:AmmeMemoRadiSam system protein B [bacterium]MDZ4284297.1 AmmeMemoRadiSam system protein B [Patescibacteria group bacterium]
MLKYLKMRRSATIVAAVAAGVLLLLYARGPHRDSSLYEFERRRISGLVVPHHDIVKDVRRALFADVARTRDREPDTIVLLSPNHFELGTEPIQSTLEPWETASGVIEPNVELIERLVSGGGVTLRPESFVTEHGVHLLLRDIKETFPRSRIVPLIFKMSATAGELDALVAILADHCARCLMVASVDFSHDQPALLADLHDAVSLRALRMLDAPQLLHKAEVDSPAALAVLALWARTQETPRFHTFSHTNSGVIVSEREGETTSHIFGWYESGVPTEQEDFATFAVGGDVMLARGVAKRYGRDLLEVARGLGERVFWGVDAALVNLEGAVSREPILPDVRPGTMTFLFPPETVEVLQHLRVNIVSLANNHASNGGAGGLVTTRQILAENDIMWIGGPGEDSVDDVALVRGQGINLVFIGVHLLVEVPDITSVIEKYATDESNRVIVFPHWGIEYAVEHATLEEDLAHAWIDAGADLVVGSHPHVIQDVAVYKNKPIVYSLGNLIFDQEFSEDTQEGLLLFGAFREGGLSIFPLPVQQKRYRPAFMRGERKKEILAEIDDVWRAFSTTSSEGTSYFFPAH